MSVPEPRVIAVQPSLDGSGERTLHEQPDGRLVWSDEQAGSLPVDRADLDWLLALVRDEPGDQARRVERWIIRARRSVGR